MIARSRLSHVLRRFHRRKKGQILVLTAFFMVVVLGFAALVVDVGLYLHGRQEVQTAVDAAALAAAQELPENGELAEALAHDYIEANDIDIERADRTISFRCIVGDRDEDGVPDAMDIPAVCDPGDGASFTCSGDMCVSACDFSSPDNKCNTIVVGGSKDVPFALAPVLGVLDAPTGDIRAAACRGSCGGPPTIPLDLVLVIDRTRSMSEDDLDNAKEAARTVLELFDPSLQHVALAVLPQSESDNHCQSVPNDDMDSPGIGEWLPVQLSDDYQNPDGTLNESSELVSTINCLERAPEAWGWGSGCWPTWCRQTNLGEPVKAAIQELGTNGRSGVGRGLIFLTDGQANLPPGNNPCLYAHDQARQAKQGHNIEFFSIGFGIEDRVCDEDQSLWRNELVTELLADMATESLDDCGHCDTSGERDVENADGDHFMCESKGEDLSPLFEHAAEVLASGARLIQIPD